MPSIVQDVALHSTVPSVITVTIAIITTITMINTAEQSRAVALAGARSPACMVTVDGSIHDECDK